MDHWLALPADRRRSVGMMRLCLLMGLMALLWLQDLHGVSARHDAAAMVALP
ncbi:hypothetical protein [Rhodobacter sp. NSM]|uniref:hypothetical protein n=1 Tax=Rhodobacter sp. NSM TaxID=3457501 RepID=UPI003FD1B7F0